MKKPKKAKFSWRPTAWWHYAVMVIGVLILLFVSAPWWNPVIFSPVKDPLIGVSFSQKRSEEMGVDWRKNYLALLDDMGIKAFRLMSYWDVHEPRSGKTNFRDLDWQIAEAKKRGATVSLAIGLRQPRWPECHQPKWS